MGTLCKNCPVRNSHKESGQPCTVAFAMRYGNSCVNLDITEQLFNNETEKNGNNKKKKESKKTETKTKKSKTTKKKETIKTE